MQQQHCHRYKSVPWESIYSSTYMNTQPWLAHGQHRLETSEHKHINIRTCTWCKFISSCMTSGTNACKNHVFRLLSHSQAFLSYSSFPVIGAIAAWSELDFLASYGGMWVAADYVLVLNHPSDPILHSIHSQPPRHKSDMTPDDFTSFPGRFCWHAHTNTCFGNRRHDSVGLAQSSRPLARICTWYSM